MKQVCEIVSIDWLIKSIENLGPVSIEDFLLTIPARDSIRGTRVGEKRKNDSQLEDTKDGPSKKSRTIPLAEYDKWAAIVEEVFQLQREKIPGSTSLDSNCTPANTSLCISREECDHVER